MESIISAVLNTLILHNKEISFSINEGFVEVSAGDILVKIKDETKLANALTNDNQCTINSNPPINTNFIKEEEEDEQWENNYQQTVNNEVFNMSTSILNEMGYDVSQARKPNDKELLETLDHLFNNKVGRRLLQDFLISLKDI